MEPQPGISSIRKEDMIELGRVLETAVSRAIVKAMGVQTMGPEKRVPIEVWERIFNYLYPSQLSRLSMVCRTLPDIVAKLPIWPKAIPKDPKSVLFGSGPYPNGYDRSFLDNGREALKKARLEYGGDISVTSSGRLSSSNAIKTRLEDDSLRLVKAMMDC
ncbi:MAG: hypothetical protein J3Q66DRAFT_394167 [Benniella sp.]|nr:MAG: hypothetical protein J3Q66DRAFT_394167 [Benniella sp.]